LPLNSKIPPTEFESHEQIKKLLFLRLCAKDQTTVGGAASGSIDTTNVPSAMDIYCNECLLEDELSLRFIVHAIWKDPNNVLTLEYQIQSF
jgi:hypothetical protein